MAKGGIRSRETLCHDIYPARPITTVSMATYTYCMMDGHSSCAPRTWTEPLMTSQAYSRRPSVIRQRLILSSAVTICQILFSIDKRYDKSKLSR